MKFAADILPEEACAHEVLRAPFPYFGGKSRVAHLVWERFGIHTHLEDRRPAIPGCGVHVEIKRPSLHRSGRGVTRTLKQTLPKLNRGGTGVARRGLSQQLPDIGGDGSSGRGIHGPTRTEALADWMHALAARLRRVRVCCGDWQRILGRSPTECIGTTAVFLDPPYSSDRDAGIYAHDSLEVAHRVREWAAEHGHNPRLRIALCGHEGEHAMPEGWTCLAWKANGGHGNNAHGRGRANAARERIWFSPHCLRPTQPDLFSAQEGAAAA